MYTSFKAIPLGYLMNLDVSYTDEEGRPLSEGKTPAHLLQGVPMEKVECPYSDSRYKHIFPMNVSALKQMTKHWKSVLSGLNAIAAKFYTGNPTLRQLHTCLVGCSMLPSYLFYRSWSPYPNGRLPAPVAAIYKVAIGMIGALEVMLVRGLITSEFDENTVVNPELIIDFADREGMFIGATEVCAGPPSMMREAINAMCSPRPSAEWDAVVGDFTTYTDYVALAEQVTYLDFLMPVVLYTAVNEKRLLTSVFQTIRRHSKEPAEISMEVQLIDITSAILDSFRKDELRKLFESVHSLFSSIGLGQEASEMFTACKEHQEKFNQLAEEIVKVARARVQNLRMLARVLAAYLLIEELRCCYLSKIAEKMNRLLGRLGRVPEVTNEEISAMFGPRLRDVLTDFLEVANPSLQPRFSQP
ncbi:MAG: hypothetical protein RMM17_05140 [Acidobacteriota bacterium]|nr:hypothetical protein [Blastocatellia bacterium]MDW8412050.1 hypothetical protein [Acidobacteriota bacterium]